MGTQIIQHSLDSRLRGNDKKKGYASASGDFADGEAEPFFLKINNR